MTAPPKLADFDALYGVDFSGAAKAGRTIWIARTTSPRRGPLRLQTLDRLDRLCGTPDREVALAALVSRILASRNALWAIDFPFGLPVELAPRGWTSQLRRVRRWADGAYAFGHDCLERARRRGGPLHIRRLTDAEQRVPFDPYHYRIIYQTFHGIRDVLGPLSEDDATAILPFHGDRPAAERIVVEACPTTTLHFLGLPHRNYKQATGGPLTPLRRRNRRAIIEGLAPLVAISDRHRRVMMRDPGADALDAVIATAALRRSWDTTDHAGVSAHPRYSREGRIYA